LVAESTHFSKINGNIISHNQYKITGVSLPRVDCKLIQSPNKPTNLALTARLVKLLKSFFIITFAFFFLHTACYAEDCSSKAFDTKGLVTFVNDGDTVKLANGKKIRLIAINAPEMNYRSGSPEPLARKAKRKLERLVLNKRVGIKYGREKEDRYGRKLAHIFLLDGTNVQSALLKTGLAFGISIPPNLWRYNCYRNTEKHAKKHKLGIWGSAYFSAIPAHKISKRKLGFQRVLGTIHRVSQSSKHVMMHIEPNLTLKIRKKHLRFFKSFSPKNLQGKSIIATGWLSAKQKAFSMYVKHPSAIEIYRL